MSNLVPRRKFLQAAVGAGLTLHKKGAASSAATLPASGAAGRSSQESTARPRLFVGCCAYSYRKYLQTQQWSMEDFILKGVELGLHGVDMTTYWFKSTEPAYLTGLRHLAFKNGLPFSGAAIGTNMCQPDQAKRATELDQIKQWVDAAELLGVSHLRVFGGNPPHGATDDQAIAWVVEVMKPACDYSAKKGITLGIEDHGGITSKASSILEILRRVDSPYAGINLDISNFPEDPYRQIEQCIPYATHTHIRDFFSRTHEAIDLDRVWQLFARGGYKGYMSVEYEGSEEPTTGVSKLLEQVKTLCKKYSTA